jgi:tagatose-1,6-bisphosphate aldolase
LDGGKNQKNGCISGHELAAEIEDMVRSVATDCHAHDLPLFVEPVSYSIDPALSKSSAEFAAQRPAIVRETARRFSKLGADVLKLEFPADADFDQDAHNWQTACEAVNAACTVPWVLLSAGVDFAVFERQVNIACRSGSSGFLAGRAIWKECVAMPAQARQQFLQTTAVERLKRLSDLAKQYGRAWTDYYQPPAAHENWFVPYN